MVLFEMDLLARMLCDRKNFRKMTKMVESAAGELCVVKVTMTHEGGYSPAHVPFCGLAVIEELSGINTGVEDPFQPSLSGHGGYKLLPHQIEMIYAAGKIIDNITS
jgi:acetoin utilization deacetylase AcuC-like enzyme